MSNPRIQSFSFLLVILWVIWMPLSIAVAAEDSTSPSSVKAVKLVGAGATFPAPLYQRWFRDYYLQHKNVRVDYQGIGSGAGITNFKGKRLDFAGSDLPLSAEEIAEVHGGALQFPMTAAAIVFAYNLPGVETINLSRKALVSLFLGQIQRWNDPLIAESNPGLALPDLAVTLVVRSDASGTTYATTRYLSAISDSFAQKVGTTMSPAWPKILQERGRLVGGRGNGGVAASVRAIPGALGYVEYTFAHLGGIPMASIENKSGAFVAAESQSFKAAVDAFRAKLTDLGPTSFFDPAGAGSYPILNLSWLLVHQRYENPNKAHALKNLIRYCLTDGQKVVEPLGYIPFREEVVTRILEKAATIQ